MKRYVIFLCLLLWGHTARAGTPRQLTIDVPPAGGVYEVPVRAGYLTIIYFPANITSFVHGQTEKVRVQQRQHILTVEVDPAAPPTTMSVECPLFRIGILLRPVTGEEPPVIQVQFRDQTQQQKVASEVAKQLEPLQAALEAERDELARRRDDLDQAILHRARRLVARALRTRYQTRPLSVIRRNDAHVIVRVTEVVWVGDDAFVRLSIQNRGTRPFRIDRVRAMAGDVPHPAAIDAPAMEREDLRGMVVASTTAPAVLLLPGAASLMGEVVDISFLDSEQRSTLSMRLPLHP